MHDLVKQYAKRLTKEKFGVKLLGGEPLGFNPEYYRLLLEDPETDQYIDLIGGHVYGSYQCKENLAKAAGYAAPKGKEVWMTEHIVNPRGDEDTENHYLPTWHEQLLFAEDVNECLVNGATAYIYWYLAKEYSFIGDGTPCTTPGNVKDELLPRGRIMGQFARHLKGSTMLKVSSNLTSNLSNNVNQSFEMSAFMRGDSLIVNVIDTLNREFKLEVTLPYRAASLHRIQSTEDAVYAEDDVEIEPQELHLPRSRTQLHYLYLPHRRRNTCRRCPESHSRKQTRRQRFLHSRRTESDQSWQGSVHTERKEKGFLRLIRL